MLWPGARWPYEYAAGVNRENFVTAIDDTHFARIHAHKFVNNKFSKVSAYARSV